MEKNNNLKAMVTDIDGKPIANALIYINQTYHTYTKGNGVYSLTVPVGNYTVYASKDGYHVASLYCEVIENKEIVLNFILIPQADDYGFPLYVHNVSAVDIPLGAQFGNHILKANAKEAFHKSFDFMTLFTSTPFKQAFVDKKLKAYTDPGYTQGIPDAVEYLSFVNRAYLLSSNVKITGAYQNLNNPTNVEQAISVINSKIGQSGSGITIRKSPDDYTNTKILKIGGNMAAQLVNPTEVEINSVSGGTGWLVSSFRTVLKMKKGTVKKFFDPSFDNHQIEIFVYEETDPGSEEWQPMKVGSELDTAWAEYGYVTYATGPFTIKKMTGSDVDEVNVMIFIKVYNFNNLDPV